MLTYAPRKFRQYRRRSGLSIAEVAKRAHLTPRGVRWIDDGAVPRADTLGRLASVFKVAVGAFFVTQK